MDIEEVKKQARYELQQEEFRRLVEAEKERLRKASWLDRLFPWKIRLVIVRKQ